MQRGKYTKGGKRKETAAQSVAVRLIFWDNLCVQETHPLFPLTSKCEG
jgi:hypothetical protein